MTMTESRTHSFTLTAEESDTLRAHGMKAIIWSCKGLIVDLGLTDGTVRTVVLRPNLHCSRGRVAVSNYCDSEEIDVVGSVDNAYLIDMDSIESVHIF